MNEQHPIRGAARLETCEKQRPHWYRSTSNSPQILIQDLDRIIGIRFRDSYYNPSSKGIRFCINYQKIHASTQGNYNSHQQIQELFQLICSESERSNNIRNTSKRTPATEKMLGLKLNVCH
ncbi:hypothetical protein SADUNF_Sadunf10G0189100 [Salix dunnii]|uniref:Uncharacterized protein n=1 Tax=Salix dunnii TaxID=1413687 RepID=A0A835JVE2_9ROSI|nr:hypothetical protein SADUNF_Sadunf10G0189100 [Salix dunnii]